MRLGWVGLGCLLGSLVATGAQAGARARIAVLPMVVHSIDAPEYLRDGLADMLASRLGRNPGIAVARATDPALATTDAEAARATARELGAEYVIFGSFTRFGQGASLDLQCQSVSGKQEPRAIFVHSGTLGEIIPSLDPLAEKVLRYVLHGSVALPELAAGGSELGEARAEIEALRQRVERLEGAVAKDTVARLPDSSAPDAETSRELR